MFSDEELKAKAPPVELCMIGDVIFLFLSYRPWKRETETQLKQAIESIKEDKTVNGNKSERLLGMT